MYINFNVVICFTAVNLCVILTECRRIKRVVGGADVDCGTALRMTSLRNSSTLQHLCGATILTPEFALTAAHCVQDNASQYVLQLNNYCDEPPTAAVLEIIKHDLYDMVSRAHDVAILRIQLDLDDITWLGCAVLPNSFGVSGECTIYGYGTRKPGSEETTEKLQAANVTLVSLDDCTTILGPIAPYYNSGMMCAVGEGTDACQGDSGGPLICNSLIEGISSYGLSCGVRGVPGVYTSTIAHIHWIRAVINKDN